MKTLDKVIKKFEMCSSQITCSTCPYFQEICSCDPDALHYLKEYRILQYSYIKTMADLEDNPPLSWQELKTMKGKPVWVEGEHGFILNHKSWVLIDTYDENDDLIICHGIDTGHYEFAISKEDYGTDWQAYRKERDEEKEDPLCESC